MKQQLGHTALKAKLLRQEEESMRNALRYSAREAGVSMTREYQALVETSESDEEEFLHRAMAQARDESPWSEEESTVEEDEEARPDDTGEEEGDSGDEGGAGPVEKPRKQRQRKKKTFIELD